MTAFVLILLLCVLVLLFNPRSSTSGGADFLLILMVGLAILGWLASALPT